MTCPLCGNEFSREEAVGACAGCPAALGCGLVRCPRCGYEMAVESRLGIMMRKWIGPAGRHPGGEAA